MLGGLISLSLTGGELTHSLESSESLNIDLGALCW